MNQIGDDCMDIIYSYKQDLEYFEEHKKKFTKCLEFFDTIFRCLNCGKQLLEHITTVNHVLTKENYCSIDCCNMKYRWE